MTCPFEQVLSWPLVRCLGLDTQDWALILWSVRDNILEELVTYRTVRDVMIVVHRSIKEEVVLWFGGESRGEHDFCLEGVEACCRKLGSDVNDCDMEDCDVKEA